MKVDRRMSKNAEANGSERRLVKVDGSKWKYAEVNGSAWKSSK